MRQIRKLRKLKKLRRKKHRLKPLDEFDIIKECMFLRNVTHQDLADQLGKHRPDITQMLKGNAKIFLSNFIMIMDVLGYKVAIIEHCKPRGINIPYIIDAKKHKSPYKTTDFSGNWRLRLRKRKRFRLGSFKELKEKKKEKRLEELYRERKRVIRVEKLRIR